MTLSTEALRNFVAVADAGSLTGAAQSLGQTTSGVSRALGKLEQQLGVTLLNRTTRRLDLTEEGALFLLHARSILAALDEAEEALLIRHQSPAGKLRVNAAAPFMLHVIVPLVGVFRQAYPQVELELNTSDQIIDLLEQRTDIAIRIGELQDSTLHARPLGGNQLRILASPAYLQRHGTPETPEALHAHQLIAFTHTATLNTWPLRHEGGHTFEITPALSASSGETIRHLALAGEGIVCLADFMTAEDRRKGGLVQILAEFTDVVRQPVHAVYYRNTQLAARISCFLDFLAARL
ncbi:LysR substrate-binding domain-containing protein [Amantichitinum ursilacus]|uniref:HTH-type transcriptional regulator DmlR n=1 Tax=Amantichitinum ursilacus TaxID=857265 RepID=A0A0N0XHG8_9NEIS|nr:LysR substrate-binding domain-containing protein [Amantichitinum ursilacus]KPC51811.1 HTH-type transcriptional regulator DmlR [Amantichitinum ursilacus]